MPVRRPMMATPSGAVFLLGGIIRSLHSPAVPPMAGRLIGGSSCIPASLRFLHCRPGSLGRGGCFAVLVRCLLLLADGGSLALADALPLCSCCLVDALPPMVTSSLADALPPFLLWRILCRRGCAFRWMLFYRLLLRGYDSTLCRSCSSGGHCSGVLFGGPPFVLLLLSAAAAVCEFVCAFSLVFLFL